MPYAMCNPSNILKYLMVKKNHKKIKKNLYLPYKTTKVKKQKQNFMKEKQVSRLL